MKRSKKKLAVLYVVVGFIICSTAVILAGMMWLSSSFLPIYVGGEFVLGNRILRYAIYAFLGFVAYHTGKLALDGIEYLL